MSAEYTNERVIGHHIEAGLETKELLTGKKLSRVRIKEGDVDWESTHEIRLSLDELADIYHTFIEVADGCSGGQD